MEEEEAAGADGAHEEAEDLEVVVDDRLVEEDAVADRLEEDLQAVSAVDEAEVATRIAPTLQYIHQLPSSIFCSVSIL